MNCASSVKNLTDGLISLCLWALTLARAGLDRGSGRTGRDRRLRTTRVWSRVFTLCRKFALRCSRVKTAAFVVLSDADAGCRLCQVESAAPLVDGWVRWSPGRRWLPVGSGGVRGAAPETRQDGAGWAVLHVKTFVSRGNQSHM